ncbi:MAG: ChaN family lipoprotein [Bacteroidales bacterium]|nr:ChaN family lipoprotein [Bacteroidales bacterium]
MKKVLILFSALLIFSAFKSDKPAYRFFNKKGKPTSYKKVIKAAKEADVVFFGELHNNPICHWFELEITKDLYAGKKPLILGAEMFERDNQLLLNEYLTGKISKKSFDSEARLWPNYKTDYQPLLAFAKEHHLPFIATNIPRRYASVVFKNGFDSLDSLSHEARSYMAPLPIVYDPELKCYKDMLEQMKSMGHASANLPKAQAIKDATMAYFIAQNAGNGKLFLHFNGAYHSDNYQGIVWYLKKYNPNLKILTITSVEQASVDSLETKSYNKADFVLTVPESMTKTY